MHRIDLLNIRRNHRRGFFRKMFGRRSLVTCLFILFTLNASAASVEEILKQPQPPDGVVFEIVEGSKNDLDWAIPRIVEDSKRLRARFPDLPIAVVSHGREEFGLTREEAKERPEVHRMVRELGSDLDVPVHVCATHASWNGVTPEDFPDYVVVSETGPAQIKDYIALGYTLVVVRKKN